MDEKELYELVCKERFDRLEAMIEQEAKQITFVLDLLKGKDNEPGLIERLRKIEDRQKTMWAGMITVIGIIATQVAIWVRQRFF